MKSRSSLDTRISILDTLVAQDALCETAYLADVAGLHYDVVAEGLAGIDIKVDGFSDKLPALTQTLFQSLAGFQVKSDASAVFRLPLALPFTPAQTRDHNIASHNWDPSIFHCRWMQNGSIGCWRIWCASTATPTCGRSRLHPTCGYRPYATQPGTSTQCCLSWRHCSLLTSRRGLISYPKC